MLAHCQKLKFEDEPDYKYLKMQLQKILKKNYTIKKMSDIEIINNNNEEMKHNINKIKQFSEQPTKDFGQENNIISNNNSIQN